MTARCGYVTGRSAARHLRDLPEERRGPQRGDTGVYDVLCGAPAPYTVRSTSCEPDDGCEERHACGRDLAAVVDDFPDDVTVQRRGFTTERRRPVTHYAPAGSVRTLCRVSLADLPVSMRSSQIGSVDCSACLSLSEVVTP